MLIQGSEAYRTDVQRRFSSGQSVEKGGGCGRAHRRPETGRLSIPDDADGESAVIWPFPWRNGQEVFWGHGHPKRGRCVAKA